MLQESLMYISWPTVGVITAILSLVITLVSRVMQQSIKGAIQDSTAALEHKITERFAAKELLASKIETIDVRLKNIERELERKP